MSDLSMAILLVILAYGVFIIGVVLVGDYKAYRFHKEVKRKRLEYKLLQMKECT